jgi:hypothetical protein
VTNAWRYPGRQPFKAGDEHRTPLSRRAAQFVVPLVPSNAGVGCGGEWTRNRRAAGVGRVDGTFVGIWDAPDMSFTNSEKPVAR